MESLILAHFAVTCGLCTLIWVIQISHYPLFHYVEPAQFKEAMLVHQGKISWIVIPLMTAELGLSLTTLHLPSIIIVALIWVTTFFIQVPLHDELARYGYKSVPIAKLVKTNWIRTFLWSLKTLILAVPIF